MAPKITLTQAQGIPFNKITLSQRVSLVGAESNA